MKSSAERVGTNTVLLEVEVDAELFSGAIEKTYRSVVKEVSVPGFRKGKTPKHILERFVGKEALYEKALEDLIPEAYLQAVKDAGIDPVDQPQIDMVQTEEGKPVIFKATVTVKPDVELGQYKGVQVFRPTTDVPEEDVQKELERMRNNHAQLIAIEDGLVELGDETKIDFLGKLDGEAFPGGKGEDFALTIGSGAFIKGFEDQMIGMSINETRDLPVTFPEEYHEPSLSGKEVVFTVTLNSIKRKELSPIDDELAKDVSEFETLAELTADIRDKMEKAAESKASYLLRRSIIDKVVDNATLEVPDSMIERQSRDLFGSIANNFANQGISITDYMAYTNTSMDKMKQEMRPEAERNVRTTLVLEAIGKAENITPTDEELHEELEKMAKVYNLSMEEFREQVENEGSMDYFMSGLIKEKTFQYLEENAVVVDAVAEAPPEEQTEDSQEEQTEAPQEEK